jgi:hypothetical protein
MLGYILGDFFTNSSGHTAFVGRLNREFAIGTVAWTRYARMGQISPFGKNPSKGLNSQTFRFNIQCGFLNVINSSHFLPWQVVQSFSLKYPFE